MTNESMIINHHAIRMSETSDEWRKGFEFATRCIYDYIHHGNKTKEQTVTLLKSIKDLMDASLYWNHDVVPIKKISREEFQKDYPND